MLDEGVESCSDGVHRIYWTRIDCPPSKQFQYLNIVTKLDHYFWNSIDAKSFTVFI